MSYLLFLKIESQNTLNTSLTPSLSNRIPDCEKLVN